ncbi:MAG: GntR family transcriptional regulator [Tepidisphaeraceae bacterium]|jgi:LacI family transcriptional regulator
MPLEPKHHEISRKLLAEIVAGKYAPSGRLPSEAQLVQRFKVSRPTVARAFRDLQDQGLIDRRVGSGTFVRSSSSSTANVGARQLGLMIPGLGTTEIFEAISGELASLARGHDYGLLWGGDVRPQGPQTAAVPQVEQWCEQFIQRQVSGVFFAPFEHIPHADDINRRLAERLRQAGIAIVLLDRDIGPFPTRSDLDLVGIDNFAAGYIAAEHLLKLGSRHICFVTRPLSAQTVQHRIAGAREAILDHRLPLPSEFIRIGEPDDALFIQRLSESVALDAILCANDQTAATIIRSLERKGRRVPQDVRLVGFDDVRYASLFSVPLTTIHQPTREIAVVAFRAMLERIADPTLPARSLMLTPSLVIRESCGAYAGRAVAAPK